MARSNDDAAAMLQEFADLLSISGEASFKVRAYERAARAVADHGADLDGLDQRGLDEIPGIGSHLASKIEELRRTGTVRELEELRARVPAGLRSLLAVPGLGPRRARQVYDELGISSLEELTAALDDHRLRALRGWGRRSEENLASTLEQAGARQGRTELGEGLLLGEELVAWLSGLPGVVRACYAGSLRRMRDTVGDVDLLVAADDPSGVMAAFCGLGFVSRVLGHGTTKSSVVTTAGLQVDLRVVDASSWGAALLYFTGSKAHNIRLREIAQHLGMKLSEYGLFEAASGKLIAAASEKEVYGHLHMPFIPPLLREDRGEIEAALSGRLPRLIEARHIRGDLHTHTALTDGEASLAEMAAAARELGYRYLAVTDHGPAAHGKQMTSEQALAQRRELRRLEEKAGIALLHGSELDIAPDGSLGWEDDFLAGFDITVASVHSAFDLPSREMTARILRAVEHPYVSVIGHPTGRSIGHRPPIEADWDEIFRAAARTGTALEINSARGRLDLDDIMIRRAHEEGVRFVVTSDAHSLAALERIAYGVATAGRGWLEPADVINTYSLPTLRRFLAHKAGRSALRAAAGRT